MRDFREALFGKVEKEIYALALKADTVFPSYEIENTLKGASRKINIKVEEIDFDYDYTHENPFPTSKVDSEKVMDSLNLVFEKVADFFNES